MTDFGVFGTSGHARETGDVAFAMGLRVVYIARDEAARKAWAFEEEVMLESELDRYNNLTCCIGVGDNQLRRQLARRFSGLVRFGNLVHPSATFGRRQHEAVAAAEGVLVCAGANLSNNIRVGNFAIFNRNSTVGHDAIVGDFVHIAPGACISGNVHLGNGSLIGAGAVVNQGTTAVPRRVGADAIVGSGSVVISDCAPAATYVGAPARRIE